MILINTDVLLTQAQTGVLTEKLITVEAATRVSGYNPQYLRRLLRAAKLHGVKIGQVWLIQLSSLESYLAQYQNRKDRRCGSRANCIQS